MAFGRKKGTTSLINRLDAVGANLGDAADNKRAAADNMVRQAGQLKNEADTHEAHSQAVQKALATLTDAGVSI